VTKTARMIDQIRWQAEACRELGSPLYAGLIHGVADDVLAGGAAATLLAGHETDPGASALALRLMGGVHRLVLQRRAPALALTYPPWAAPVTWERRGRRCAAYW